MRPSVRRKNGGIFGVVRSPTTSSASGIWSSFQIRNSVISSTWPTWRTSVASAPVSVGVSRSGAGTVTITWGASASNGNSPITGYGVYITNQNGGGVAASTTTGPTTYSVNFGTDNHGSYNGYVYAINGVGNSTTAGGGAACAYYGYNFSQNNCSGYTRYDTYTDGNCGFYNVTTQTNSPSCGYVDPCAGSPGYGTYLGNYCSGYTLINRYSDGCNGYYDSVAQYNSGSCGYVSNPCAGCLAAGRNLGGYCDGNYNYYGTYSDGCCGTYQAVQECSAICGC